MGGSDNKGDGPASQPRRYWVPGQPLLNRHQVGGVSRSPDGLLAQQEWEPIRGRPAVSRKGTYGGPSGQGVEEQGTWASRTLKHSKADYGRPVDRGAWTAKTVKRARRQPAQPQYANYWVRARKETTTRRNVTQGVPHSVLRTRHWRGGHYRTGLHPHPRRDHRPDRHAPASSVLYGAWPPQMRRWWSHKSQNCSGVHAPVQDRDCAGHTHTHTHTDTHTHTHTHTDRPCRPTDLHSSCSKCR